MKQMIKLFGIKPALKELKGITRDFRVSWMLEELNLNYEFVVLDPQKGETQTPEYLKLNPTGKVPTLSDGEFSIFESSAICSYLAHKEKKLIPEQETPEKKFGLQKYVTGNDFLLVDLLFVTCLLYIHHTDLLESYPNLTKYLQAAENRTAFKKAFSRISYHCGMVI